ncbi:lytic transglycosylase domain-containing protein [Thermodesulfatator indicus]|uniref:lytic transglycosylase domain-containing protein n=1 Tax=Thermodesulfatator indicus TaxID=171695 RepID=UPI00145F5048|nr:lytic transglycosylase domain-containing protein [Thermodesulfatator indicus]
MLYCSTSYAELYYYKDASGNIYITNIPTNKPLWKNTKAKIPEKIFKKAGRLYGIDPALLKAMAKVESNFDPYAISPKGARGLMQLMPSTAKIYGVRNCFHTEENVKAAAAFLKDLLEEFENLELALAAYNAGPNKVKKFKKIPPYPETRRYVKKVLYFYSKYKK